ncbi:MAG: sulfatase-like hydrolase/transferase [Pirellulaceae bacterium]|jgi:arylsulfatase|nr:sulfatase-like hydrolase/transferase [Pirellulaceae bacterium]HJN12399.1 sulfatase-like hydrolase/transferase [Pirellulaceae bacterium]
MDIAERSKWARLLTAVTTFLLTFAGVLPAVAVDQRPNIILIFTDDQGYQDLGCFGSKTIKTPNLDRMATEGGRLTSFYAQPVCGVSRAALMTGSYPIRVGEPGNRKLLHTVPHPKEITMAEVLKDAGYATGMVGKWHLTQHKSGAPGGFDPATMPNAQGFDYFYGTPLYNGFTVQVEDTKFRSPIFHNGEVVVEAVESWDQITANYTREAISWIKANRERPFFLYLAHNLPHIPVGASEEFKGKSAGGPYGDTIEEIDWSCGEVFKTLKELDIDDQTLVVFTSDNGPWVETTRGMKPDGKPFIPRDHSGNAEPLRGWKMSAWEGGSRVPFIARWPDRIPAGWSSDEILSTMDLLPTFAAIARGELPAVELDGKDATDFLTGQSQTSPRDEYFYYAGCLVTGVRSGPWKLVLPRSNQPLGLGWWGRMIEAVPQLQLYNLHDDPGETKNVASNHAEVVTDLMKRIERARKELGDIDRTGEGARFHDDGPRRLQVPVKKQAGNSRENAKAVPSKYDGFKPLGNLRFTFESGKLEGWEILDGQAGHSVSDHLSLPRWQNMPFNHQGKFHLSTVATPDGFSDKQTVVLQSPTFVIRGDRASFLASGGFDKQTLFVGLFDAETGDIVRAAGGPKGPQMKRTIWDVRAFKGKSAFLRIVDRNQSGWGHLTFDDFSIDGTLQPSSAQEQ